MAGSSQHGKRADLQCTLCHRSFAKPEHLQRHQRVHTGARPFACTYEQCDKRFSRPDSLARHAKTHTGLSPRSSTPAVRASASPAGDIYVHYSSGERDGNPPTIPDAFGLTTPSTTAALGTEHTAAGGEDGGEYLWSDSEDLFALLTADPMPWTVDGQTALPCLPLGNSSGFAPDKDDLSNTNAVQARQAIRHVDNLIQDISFNLTSELAALGATSHFLDTCMSCFWSCFIPVFPVLHRPTFVLKDYSPPTLLNMIALGSLFMVEKGAMEKGEVLWRLAHHALATSWQNMLGISKDASSERCMLLVMTALLGQCYAVMSGNKSIRLIGHVFHRLGLYWAHQTGMHDNRQESRVCVSDHADDTTSAWHRWASNEVRIRALTGLYILDGVITQSSGMPSSTCHTINNLDLPCEDATFEAEDAASWRDAMRLEPPRSNQTTRQLLLELFDPSRLFCAPPLSHMSLPILLEALQSLVSVSVAARGPAIGVPDQQAIGRALLRLYSSQIEQSRRPGAEVTDLTIRWHVVCINLYVQPGILLRDLCRRYQIEQSLFTKPLDRSHKEIDPSTWCSSHWARRALLHAIAVIDLVQHLSFRHIHALHLPLALNTAATILISFVLGGHSTLRLPKPLSWTTVCDLDEGVRLASGLNDRITTFIHTGEASGMAPCNLLLHINTAQSMLKSHMRSWTVTQEMSHVLQRLAAQRS